MASEDQPSSLAGSDGSRQSWQHAGMILSLEPDQTSPGLDSESESSSITTSLASTATEYRYEHGRRYHAYADSKYALPNDQQEAERLELQHLIWMKTLNGRLYLAPVSKDMTDALDIGTGTGTWAIEFAHAHPNTRVIGTDLSPIQPEYIPLNCSWLIDDASKPWPSEFGGKFDFVHTRAISMGIGNWDGLISQAWDALKPGGWIELQEFSLPLGCDDGTVEGTALEQWGLTAQGAAARIGIDVQAAKKHADRLRARGFGHVREVRLKSPIGPWAKGKLEKEVGVMGLRDLHDNLAGLSVKLFSIAGHSLEAITEMCDKAKVDMTNPKIHTYMPLVIALGQKPREETPSAEVPSTAPPEGGLTGQQAPAVVSSATGDAALAPSDTAVLAPTQEEHHDSGTGKPALDGPAQAQD